ncbi:sulfate ABC transporter permease, partial [Streptomyces sp. NRRL WC-3753]
MASTDTTRPAKENGDLAGLEAGLDALESVQQGRTPLRQTLVEKVLPPSVAVLLVLAVWQGLVSFKIVDDPTKLPAPSDVWDVVHQAWLQGELLGYIWTSVSR